MNKKFLPPEIYNAKGKLEKRWNITYWIFNQRTDKFDRFQHWISSSKFPSRTLREREARKQCRNIHKELKSGDHEHFRHDDYMIAHPVLKMAKIWLKRFRQERSTQATYSAPFTHLKKFLKLKRRLDIMPLDFTSNLAFGFTDYLLSLELTNKTINHYSDTLRRFFDFLKDEDIIRRNPFRNTKKLKEREMPLRRYTVQESKVMMDKLKQSRPDLYCFSMMVYYTFMRLKEVGHLQVKHFDLKNRIIHVPSVNVKNNKYKNPRISDPLLPIVLMLDLNGDPERFVFSKNGNKPHGRDFMPRKFRKMFPGKTIYRFKHSGMQHHKDAGVPIDDIQAQGCITESVMRKNYLEVDKRKVSDAILSMAPAIGEIKSEPWKSVLAQLRLLSIEDQKEVKKDMGW